jgi:hypothetical protein
MSRPPGGWDRAAADFMPCNMQAGVGSNAGISLNPHEPQDQKLACAIRNWRYLTNNE